MKPTFVDAGVLIAAIRGDTEQSVRALEILNDPERTFASTEFVRLETLPKAVFCQKTAESAFYESFFSQTAAWVDITPDLVSMAFDQAARFGLGAADSLHVAAAKLAGSAEL